MRNMTRRMAADEAAHGITQAQWSLWRFKCYSVSLTLIGTTSSHFSTCFYEFAPVALEKGNFCARLLTGPKEISWASDISAASMTLQTQNKVTCTSINLRILWRSFHRPSIVLSLCVKRYGISFSLTRTVCSLGLHQIHQRSCTTPLLKRLITL